ncbi:MAG: 50S ribosomal protein L18 [Nanoarchaeota archaeon]
MVKTIHYQRKGKTDYKTRLKLLTGNVPRLVVRPSLHNVLAQAVQYHEDGDKVLVSAHSRELKKYGWPYGTGNTPAAYLVGFLLGSKAKDKVSSLIPDLGSKSKAQGTKLYAVVKGVLDAGIPIPHDPSIFPSEDRLNGKHISSYAKQSKGQQFSALKQADFDAMPTVVQQMKKAIQEGSHDKSRK